jgi:hypothetical protein
VTIISPLDEILVVCEYPDVFPDELPGMPPDRDVEFVIELQPGTALLTVYFGTPSMFITLWFGLNYGTNPPLGTLII